MIIVITINYNLHKHTIPCVQSILESNYKDFMVYLVDNGSHEDDYNALLKEFSKNAKVKVLRIEKNRGYVGGVNFGLEAASKENPDYFLVMNNDTIIDKDAIGYLVDAAMRHDNKAIVSGKVYYFDHPNVIQHTGVIFTDKRYLKTTYPGRNKEDKGQFDKELERDSLDDVFWLLPAEVFNSVGYYSHFFFLYAEQGDYAQRARRYGFKLIYTPKAKLWHKESLTTGGGDSKALHVCYWRGQGMFIFQYRNLKRRYFFPFMVRNFFRYFFKVITSKGKQKQEVIAIFRGYIAGFFWMFNKRPNTGYNPYL